MEFYSGGIIVLLFLSGGYGQEPKDLQASLDNIQQNLYNVFSKPRNHIKPDYIAHKERVRDFIYGYFTAIRRDPDIVMETVDFDVPAHTDYYNKTATGRNFYLIYKGEKWDTKEDKIVTLTAQYDTAADANGVDNNGSGMTSLLEVARLLALAKCPRLYTIVLVANDWEEYGSWGIKEFINNFLVPKLLKNVTTAESPEFQGAICYDTMMNWNDTDGSQILPVSQEDEEIFKLLFPDLYHWFNVTNRRRGNFMLSVSRYETDQPLADKLHEAWRSLPLGDKYLELRLGFPFCEGVIIDRNLGKYNICRTFLRADYKEFYAYNTTRPLKAMMVTDSAQYRGVMQGCYAQPCDDLSQVTPEKLQHLTKICKSTLDALLDMSGYQCLPSTAQPTFEPTPQTTSSCPTCRNCPTTSGARGYRIAWTVNSVFLLIGLLTIAEH